MSKLIDLTGKRFGRLTVISRAEQKGRNAISFRSYTKLIFSTNELPLVKNEKTNGFYWRLLVLPMNRVPENKNLNLMDELI